LTLTAKYEFIYVMKLDEKHSIHDKKVWKKPSCIYIGLSKTQGTKSLTSPTEGTFVFFGFIWPVNPS